MAGTWFNLPNVADTGNKKEIDTKVGTSKEILNYSMLRKYINLSVSSYEEGD